MQTLQHFEELEQTAVQTVFILPWVFPKVIPNAYASLSLCTSKESKLLSLLFQSSHTAPYLDSLPCSSTTKNHSGLVFSCTFPVFNIYSICVHLYLPLASLHPSLCTFLLHWLHLCHNHPVTGIFCLCSSHYWTHPFSLQHTDSSSQCISVIKTRPQFLYASFFAPFSPTTK